MLKINSIIIWGKFFKSRLLSISLNANKNNSCIEMSLVLNLKEVGDSGQMWAHITKYTFIKDGEERRMES